MRCFTRGFSSLRFLKSSWCSIIRSYSVLCVSPLYRKWHSSHSIVYVQFLFLQSPGLVLQDGHCSLSQGLVFHGAVLDNCSFSFGPRVSMNLTFPKEYLLEASSCFCRIFLKSPFGVKGINKTVYGAWSGFSSPLEDFLDSLLLPSIGTVVLPFPLVLIHEDFPVSFFTCLVF